jgi:hypothetical protein
VKVGDFSKDGRVRDGCYFACPSESACPLPPYPAIDRHPRMGGPFRRHTRRSATSVAIQKRMSFVPLQGNRLRNRVGPIVHKLLDRPQQGLQRFGV